MLLVEALMDSGEQLQAYLYWLKDRGLKYFPATESKPNPIGDVMVTGRGFLEDPMQRRSQVDVKVSSNSELDSPGTKKPPTMRVLVLGDQALTAKGKPEFALAERDLLDRMIAAMGLGAHDIFITHAASSPSATNLDADSARLKRLVEDLNPEVVIAFGPEAARIATRDKDAFAEIRGRLIFSAPLGRHVLATYHPRELLKDPAHKRTAWGDLQVAMGALGLLVKPPPRREP